MNEVSYNKNIKKLILKLFSYYAKDVAINTCQKAISYLANNLLNSSIIEKDMQNKIISCYNLIKSKNQNYDNELDNLFNLLPASVIDKIIENTSNIAINLTTNSTHYIVNKFKTVDKNTIEKIILKIKPLLEIIIRNEIKPVLKTLTKQLLSQASNINHTLNEHLKKTNIQKLDKVLSLKDISLIESLSKNKTLLLSKDDKNLKITLSIPKNRVSEYLLQKSTSLLK